MPETTKQKPVYHVTLTYRDGDSYVFPHTQKREAIRMARGFVDGGAGTARADVHRVTIERGKARRVLLYQARFHRRTGKVVGEEL
jgi:hypothetical protein